MKESEKYQVGQKIIITKRLERKTEWRFQSDESPIKDEWLLWKERASLNEVYIVGIRNVSDGIMHRCSEGSMYEPKIYRRVLLVTHGLYTKPFYAVIP